MPVVVVANPKGGVGKSTMATNIAGYFASKGHSVMLGDADRQQSSRRWLDVRPPQLLRIDTWEFEGRDTVKPALAAVLDKVTQSLRRTPRGQLTGDRNGQSRHIPNSTDRWTRCERQLHDRVGEAASDDGRVAVLHGDPELGGGLGVGGGVVGKLLPGSLGLPGPHALPLPTSRLVVQGRLAVPAVPALPGDVDDDGDVAKSNGVGGRSVIPSLRAKVTCHWSLNQPRAVTMGARKTTSPYGARSVGSWALMPSLFQ